jgi:hypothetical protein
MRQVRVKRVAWLKCVRELRYERPARGDLFRQRAVALGVDLIEARGQHGQRAPAGLQRGGVGDRVDADRQRVIVLTYTHCDYV